MDTLQMLQTCKGKGTSLVTLTVKAGSTPADVSSRMTSELSASSNIKSRVTRQRVQRALRSISAYCKTAKSSAFSPNGAAIFAGQCV